MIKKQNAEPAGVHKTPWFDECAHVRATGSAANTLDPTR